MDRSEGEGRTGQRRRLASVLLLRIVWGGLCLLLAPIDGALGGSVPAALPGAEPLAESLRRELERELASRGADYEPRSKHRREDGSPVYSNRLLLEGSPYLQQHAHNPVNWYPWGDEAFAAARRLGRPVLVSIGYSTCHWCHVMEEETFDEVEPAEYLNAHFIAIKVDREVRPDVDAIYMGALHAMGEHGGWPLNVWLTPDGKPFYGGTYFPPKARGRRPAFMDVLRQIHARYSESPESLIQSADSLAASLKGQLEGSLPTRSYAPGAALLVLTLDYYEARFDRSWGGLGSQTKFPSSLPIRLLLREHRRTGSARALESAVLTLEKMAAGGMHDQLGGGFHRYSTEPRWLIPHFEKMLYDNALLAVAYLEAGQLTGREDLTRVATRTLDYVLREMTDPAGGFYSATDADSKNPEGHAEEGSFFTWTPAQMEAVLGPERARVPIAWYGVTPAGQYEGRNILHTWRDESEVAEQLELSVDELRAALELARRELFAARQQRTPPLRDDKVLAAWNGLMISALARAGFTLSEPRYLEAARRAAGFVLRDMRRDGRLHRVWLRGRASGPAFLEDYAFLIAGLLDLYEADANPRWLRGALSLQATLDARYLDEVGGAYYKTADDGEALLARERPSRDGAVPSGNSVQASNLLRLAALTSDDRYLERLGLLYAAFGDLLERHPAGLSELLLTVSDQLAGMREVVLVAPERGGEVEAMLRPVREGFVPNRVLVVVREGEPLERLSAIVPSVQDRRAISGQVTAYVCENRVCGYATRNPETLRAQLGKPKKPRATQ